MSGEWAASSRPPDALAGRRFALAALVAWLTITVAFWGLAFIPLERPPRWLESAREVCFGTLPNGLPDTRGWITLIASPLGVLGFLLGVWGRELKAGLRQLRASRAGLVLLAAMSLVPIVGLTAVAERVTEARRATFALDDPRLPAELPATYPRTDRPAPALSLADQRGEIVRTADLAGRPAVVTFAYAHCATICPRIVYNAKRGIAATPVEGPQLVVVTLDPWRDTPSSLPTVVEAWRLDALPRAHVLSGDVDAVLKVIDEWGVPFERDLATGEIVHPGLVYVLDSGGSIAYTLNNPPPGWISRALAQADGGSKARAG